MLQFIEIEVKFQPSERREGIDEKDQLRELAGLEHTKHQSLYGVEEGGSAKPLMFPSEVESVEVEVS